LEFISEFYDSNFRTNLKLGQKGDLFQLKLSITQPSLENFEQPEDHCFQFSKLWQSIYWKKLDYWKKGFNGPARLHSVVRCRFEPDVCRALERRASIHRPNRAGTPRRRVATVPPSPTCACSHCHHYPLG
jgi:hypothetical protein